MLDIGSNIGLTSVPRAMMRQFTHIHAFEPEPKNFACLQASVEANGLGNRMTAWNLAVGAATSSGWIRLRSGMARHDMATLADNDTVACGVTSLDAWMEEQGVPPEDIRFVKVDVQGFEANVLHGASKILQLGKAVWQLEATPVLLERYGTPQEKFVALLKEHFSWFCDMENIRLGFRPILELQPGLGLTDRKFTDLILFRSPSLN